MTDITLTARIEAYRAAISSNTHQAGELRTGFDELHARLDGIAQQRDRVRVGLDDLNTVLEES
jgi:chaperonin cofactor prefoldin